MLFECCYPQEIVEWAQQLPEPELCSPQQRRIATILEDEKTILRGHALMVLANEAPSRSDAKRVIDEFRAMVETAALIQ